MLEQFRLIVMFNHHGKSLSSLTAGYCYPANSQFCADACFYVECVKQRHCLQWPNRVPSFPLRPWAQGQPWKGSANDCRTKAKCLTARQGEAGETRLT